MAAKTPYSTKQRASLASTKFYSPSDSLSPVSLALAAQRRQPQAVRMRQLVSADTPTAKQASRGACPSPSTAEKAPIPEETTVQVPKHAAVLSPSTKHRPNMTGSSFAKRSSAALKRTGQQSAPKLSSQTKQAVASQILSSRTMGHSARMIR